MIAMLSLENPKNSQRQVKKTMLQMTVYAMVGARHDSANSERQPISSKSLTTLMMLHMAG
jgi:hypothetical protein